MPSALGIFGVGMIRTLTFLCQKSQEQAVILLTFRARISFGFQAYFLYYILHRVWPSRLGWPFGFCISRKQVHSLHDNIALSCNYIEGDKDV
jgi:hypothetical protein